MGFQDRDYNRYEPYDEYGYRSRNKKRGPMSMTMQIVLINVALWLVDGLFFAENHLLTRILELQVSALMQPLRWYEFLSYGFVHSWQTFWHLGGNMIGLIMFGYGMMLGIGPGGFGLVRGENVEGRLGRWEYLLFYLLTIIIGGVTYALINIDDPRAAVLGASGGVTGVIILYALFFPHKTLLVMGIIPMPMWLLGVLIVYMDMAGSKGYGNEGIAYPVHLAGAAFAVIYYFLLYKNRRRLTDVFHIFKDFKTWFKRKPKLHVYHGSDEQKPAEKTGKDVEFEKRLDEILARYGKVGESGLTPEERRFLQQASKKYRDKK